MNLIYWLMTHFKKMKFYEKGSRLVQGRCHWSCEISRLQKKIEVPIKKRERKERKELLGV